MKTNLPSIIYSEETPQFKTWLVGAIKINEDHRKAHYSSLPSCKFTVQQGTRYIKVMRDNSAHAFIDRTNGDVLKPASWRIPAKHARGNIMDDKNGLGSMSEYGPNYLK